MSNALRLPAALRGRSLSAFQEKLVHELYAARERVVPHEALREAIFDGDPDQYRVMRLVHQTRVTIQGTGWHIATSHGRGYSLIWVDKDAPEEPPEAVEIMRFLAEDQRAIRADIAMLADDMRQALAQLTSIPPHMLLPSSVWTAEIDSSIILSKGITGKLKAIANRTGIDAAAIVSRYKALRSTR